MPDQPQQPAAPAKDPVIYTIPDQFYGLAAKAQLPKEVAPVSAAAGLPGAVVPAAPPVLKKSGGKKWLLIPIFAVVFLGLLSVAAWWFLRPQAPAPAPTPSVTLPTPTPAPEPAPAPTPAPATTTPETPAPVVLDSDDDGLTDVEETLYTTNQNSTDSDGDGYSDSLEVVNLYNPAGFKPTKLIEAGLVKMYVDTGAPDQTPLPFALLYPSTWQTNPTAQYVGVNITAPDGQHFMITEAPVEAKGKTPLDWYVFTHPGISPSQVQTFQTKSGWEGVRGPDGLTACILAGDVLYEAQYVIPTETPPTYLSTFMMVLNSFNQKP